MTALALMRAARGCARGVRWKPAVAEACLPGHRAREATLTSRRLNAGTWRPSRLRVLRISLPKPRVVLYPGFSERVVHRALADARLYRELTRPLVHDTCACQKGKGPHYAVRRLVRQLDRLRLTGREWLVRLDVRSFFDSLDHDELARLVDRHVSSPADRAVIMSHVRRFRRGIGLGSQLSQMLANLYLSGMDHHLLERCHPLAYVRYADDVVMVARDRGHAESLMSEACGALARVRLEPNGRSRTQPLSQPFGFLRRSLLTRPGRALVSMSPGGLPRAVRHVLSVLRRHGLVHHRVSLTTLLAHFTGATGARLRRMVSDRRGWRGTPAPLRVVQTRRIPEWSLRRTRHFA